jgi:hypothetical protein
MYTKYKNGSIRHQFVSKEMSKDVLKEEVPIRGISNSTVDVDKMEPSSNNERKNDRKKERKKERKKFQEHWPVISPTITTGSR